MRRKIGNDNTSRGYCGWHTTWNGEKVYLRSRIEYILARLLDRHNISYKTEIHTYDIDGTRYKPDFFIFNKKGDFKRVIEIKYGSTDAMEYLLKYKQFFNNMNISYIVFYKKHTDRITRKYSQIKKDVNEWIKTSANIIHDMKGDKNPHYKIKHSDETKHLIGQKTLERFNNDAFREKHRSAMKRFMTVEAKQHLSSIRKGTPTLLVDEKQITTPCIHCGCDVLGTEWYKKGILMKRVVKKFCSMSCIMKNRMAKEIEVKKMKQIELMKQYFDDYGEYPMRKIFKTYCKENNVGCDIRSTFGTHTNFVNYMEVING